MKSLLTKRQKEVLEHLAKRVTRPETRISFHEDNSLTGFSWTLRYRIDWIERHQYTTNRYATSMVFSVTIPDTTDQILVKQKRELFEAKVKEAMQYYKDALRKLKSA